MNDTYSVVEVAAIVCLSPASVEWRVIRGYYPGIPSNGTTRIPKDFIDSHYLLAREYDPENPFPYIYCSYCRVEALYDARKKGYGCRRCGSFYELRPTQ